MPPSYTIDRANVVSDVIEGEAVIINLNTGAYYSLNDTGSALWSLLLRGSVSVPSVTADMAGRYSGEGETIREAVEATLARLLSEGLVLKTAGDLEAVNPRDTGSQATSPGAAHPPASPPFVAPALEVHTDMQDFLLVDPIHEVDEAGRPAESDQK